MKKQVVTPIISTTVAVSNKSSLNNASDTNNYSITIGGVDGQVKVSDVLNAVATVVRNYITPISKATPLPSSAIKPALDKVVGVLAISDDSEFAKLIEKPINLFTTITDTNQKDFHIDLVLSQVVGDDMEVLADVVEKDVWAGKPI